MDQTPEIRYTDIGQGQPVVLIHGLCESKEIWSEFSAALSGDYRIISVDVPGFGDSLLGTIESPSIEHYADRLYQTLSQLKLPPFIMAGHSLGGYIMLAFEEKYSPCLSGIVLFHSTAFADSEEKKENRNKTIDFVQKNGSGAFAEVLIPTLFTKKNLTIFKDKVNQILKKAAQGSSEGIIFSLKAMRDRKDQTGLLKNIKKPVLFIVGKEDTAVPLDMSLKQCHLPEESLTYFLSETAHMGMIEKFQETLGIFKDFLDLCRQRTGSYVQNHILK